MICTNCRTPLEQIIYEEMEIDSCKKCGGIFLNEGEIEQIEISRKKIIDKKKRYSKSKSQERRRTCPKCDIVMTLSKYGKFIERTVDKCPECEGIWLDKGELEDIQVAYEMYEENIRRNRNKP